MKNFWGLDRQPRSLVARSVAPCAMAATRSAQVCAQAGIWKQALRKPRENHGVRRRWNGGEEWRKCFIANFPAG